MNEKTSKRREWVKTAAIIFLSLMLVLTFFSNTIMNYSLPIVAAQYINSGTITAKVRGNGIIEAADPYNVELGETRVIKSVAVKEGDVVEKDQVLFYLEDAESEELKTAEEALETAVLAYEQSILSGDISKQAVTNAQNGNINTVEEYQAKISAADKAEADAQAVVDNLQTQIAEIDRQLSVLGFTTVDTTAEKKALTEAKTNLTNAQNQLYTEQTNLSNLETELSNAEAIIRAWDNGTVSSGDLVVQVAFEEAKLKVVELPIEIQTAKDNVTNWNNKVNECQAVYDMAQLNLENKENNTSKENNLKTQLANLKAQKSTADANLLKTQEDKQTLLADIQAELSLGSQNDKIKELREEVEKLRAESIGAEVKAPVAGTISELYCVAGETVKPDSAMAVIQPNGKGFSLKFAVTADQAKRLTPGDPAEVQNSWYYSDITATLAQITNDPENPGKNKLLVFDIEGDVMGGQSLSLSVGQKSANYDMIVPNSAIREDNNGKFVLIVESKSSPLGNRYIATRVDVEVLASDDTQSAISGALYGYEFVITTSNKPVEAGKQVRLSDS